MTRRIPALMRRGGRSGMRARGGGAAAPRTYAAVTPSSGNYVEVSSGNRPAVTAGLLSVWTAWVTDVSALTLEQTLWSSYQGSSGYRHILRDGSPGRLLSGYRDGGGTSRQNQTTLPAFATGEVNRTHYVFRQNGANYELEQYHNGVSIGTTTVAVANGFTDATGALRILDQVVGGNTDNTRFLAVAAGVGKALSDAEVTAHDTQVVGGGAFEFPGCTHLFDAVDYAGGGTWVDSVAGLSASVMGTVPVAAITPVWAS